MPVPSRVKHRKLNSWFVPESALSITGLERLGERETGTTFNPEIDEEHCPWARSRA